MRPIAGLVAIGQSPRVHVVPLAYLPGNSLRVRRRVIGDIAGARGGSAWPS